jgi:hypothetical protein
MASRPKQLGTRSTEASPGRGTTLEAGSGESDGHLTYQVVTDMINRSRESLDANMSALEARIDNRLARLDSIPTYNQLLWVVGTVVIGGFFAVLTAFITILSYGGDRFDGGAQFGSYTVEQTLEARRQSDDNAKQIGEIGRRVDLLLDLMGRRTEEKPR